MEPSPIVQLTPGKTDKERAQEYRDQLVAALAEACAIMTRARADGFTMGFNLQSDGMGKTFVNSVSVSKEL